jgi:hypothetical protein
MKSAVPREIVNAGGGFEEDDGLSACLRFFPRDKPRHARDFHIVDAADESAFEALGEKLFHPALPIIGFLITQSYN